MSDDVLKHWAHCIAEAEMMSDLPGGDPWADPMHCIRDLAAALRAERERVADLWSTKFVFCTYCGQRYDYEYKDRP